MKALVVYAHAKKDGFARSAAAAAVAALEKPGASARFVDLYAEGFDPVLTADELPRKISFDGKVADYQDAVKEADRLVFVHPDWWGGPPAILKGFLDRVFRPGVAYAFRGTTDQRSEGPGLLAGKRADVLIATDALPPASGIVRDWPPAAVWADSALAFCGIPDARVHPFWNLRGSTFAERRAWLESIPALLA